MPTATQEQSILEAQPRTPGTKNDARRVRRDGKIPAVVYGAGKQSLPVSVDPRQVSRILHSQTGHNTVFDLAVDGERTKAMIVDWQYEPIKGSLLHIDLKRIAMDQKLKVTVRHHVASTVTRPETTRPLAKARGCHRKTAIVISERDGIRTRNFRIDSRPGTSIPARKYRAILSSRLPTSSRLRKKKRQRQMRSQVKQPQLRPNLKSSRRVSRRRLKKGLRALRRSPRRRTKSREIAANPRLWVIGLFLPDNQWRMIDDELKPREADRRAWQSGN